MRVLHLPIIIGNQAYEMSHALRSAGIESDYMVFNKNDDWLLLGEPDYNLNIGKGGPYFKSNIRKISAFFMTAALKYDIFHYHSNIPLFFNYFDLKVLKKLGKKIVVSYWGCDVRIKSINLKYPYNTCSGCQKACNTDNKLEYLAQFSGFADLKIVSMPELLEFVPNSVYFPALVDEKFWQPESKKVTDKIIIFHPVGNSQTRGDAKGTQGISNAVKRLQQEGMKVELIFSDFVPTKGMPKLYKTADLVIEQLRCGWHGATALEAMAKAKPVIAYIRPGLEKYEPNLPIINANLDNIYSVLKELLKKPEQFMEIGLKSRAFIEKERNLKMMGGKLHRLYKSLY